MIAGNSQAQKSSSLIASLAIVLTTFWTTRGINFIRNAQDGAP